MKLYSIGATSCGICTPISTIVQARTDDEQADLVDKDFASILTEWL